MALNFPGPYEVRLFYTVNHTTGLYTHSARYNVVCAVDPNPGDAFSTISVVKRNTDTVALDVAVDTWVALLQPLFVAAPTAFLYAELWKYDPLSFEASFVSTYDISLAGTGGGSVNPGGQAIFTFRTQEGGVMKVSLMETAIASGGSLPYVSLNAAQGALVDTLTNGTTPWLARDTSYPFAFVQMHPGVNEALYKKRFRP